MFLRKSRLEPLPITMTGVRMGERLLHIGIDDPDAVGALAKKVGLSGVNALIAHDESSAERARSAAAAAAVLVDVQVAPWRNMPFTAESFDVIVVHSTRGLLASMTPEDRVGTLQEAHRVLRNGGRVIVIESMPRGGLAGLLRGHKVNEHYAAAGGAEGALKAEGFKPVRVLGEVEGYRFTEGLKT
jgi:ubiquinone/menaquinone biosynthesis C-methylase UbiE